MKIDKLQDESGQIIEGPLTISPNIFSDDRGYFYESWNAKYFNEAVGSNINSVQENHS